VIEAVDHSSNGQREAIRSIMEDGLSLEERRERLLPIIHEADGFHRAGETAREYARQASECLSEFPDNEATESLRMMCDYVVNRNF
jgi:octaprenyl-diphosphate synthase